MLPPPGLEPTITNLLQNGIPTTAAITTSLLHVGVDFPTPTMSSLFSLASHTTSPPPDPDNGECRLLGPFAILVQGALGILALSALVYKRWRERPQRPLKIWFFDVSKQVVGSVLVHVANLLMSMLSSGQFSMKIGPEIVASRSVDETEQYAPNPCSFYLLNLAIDVSPPSWSRSQTDTNMIVDHNRYSNPYYPPSNLHRSISLHTLRHPPRIHLLRKLR